MKRKFTLPGIELPKLINSLRPDGDSSRIARDLYAEDLDSRPPTPKSVRPPLPRDLNSELVAACTWIVTHPKPSHERWETTSSKPALDPAIIKHRYAMPQAEIPQRTKSSRSMNSINALLPATKGLRKPGLAGASNTDQRMEIDHSAIQIAQSRADELMQSEPLRTVTTLHIPRRSSSRNHNRSASAASNSKSDPAERQRTMARSDSSCTTRTGRTGRTAGSTPHTDSTEYPRSASTGMTSVANTPARSKSASSQAVNAVDIGSVPDDDAISGDLLRQEFERHRKAAAGKDTGRMEGENALCKATYMPGGDMYFADELALANMQVQRRSSRSQSCSSSGQNLMDGMQSSRQNGRSTSRFRSESRTGARSESRTGTIGSEMRSRYNRSNFGKQLESRASSVARSMKRYLRPSNSLASLVTRDDTSGSRPTTSSHRSVHSPTSEPDERPRGRWAGLRRGSRSSSRQSSGNGDRVREPETRGKPLDPFPMKPAVDLNRELPPLPSLNQWTEQEGIAPDASTRPATSSTQQSIGPLDAFPKAPTSGPPQFARDLSSGLPPEFAHLHPLHRPLPQIPPMVDPVATGARTYAERVGVARPAVPLRGRKPVPTATVHAVAPSISSSNIASPPRETGKRRPLQTVATPDPTITPEAQPILRRSKSHRLNLHMNFRGHQDHSTTTTALAVPPGHTRTRSDLAHSPRNYSIDQFKRKMMQPPHKSELDLSHQKKSSRVERNGSQAPQKSAWKAWAKKFKPKTATSHADLLTSSRRPRDSTDSSGAAASPVIHY